MKRIALIIALFVAAAAVAIVPAVIGLADNPSFSHQLPVRVPSSARSLPGADDVTAEPDGRERERRDDRAGVASHEPGDDRGARHDGERDRGGT